MTLSEDGQWMWDGNQWVPAQNAPPAAPPVGGQPGFSDPNSQSWNAPQPFGGQPMATPNPGGWAPDSSSPSAKKSLPVAAIVAVVILIVAGATGGILWATGVFGSSADDLVGVWYGGDDRDGVQFKKDGSFIIIEDGDPASDYSEMFDSLTWSVSGDRIIMTFTAIVLTADDFECDNGDEIPARWVNDGDNDCGDNSDEGVNVRNYPHETNSFSSESKFEIVGDVLFVGMLKQTQTEGGSVETEEILESQVCTSEEGDCDVMVRASAMGGGLSHAMIVSGETSPDWWADTSENYDEDDW